METDAIKLLMLEDNADDALLIQATLKRAGTLFDIRLVSDKAGFIQALDSFCPAIILSDHQLLQFDSIEALQISKDKCPHVPFILVTGTVSEEFAVNIIKSGADDYILKDRLSRLAGAIDAALKQRLSEKEKNIAEKKLIESEEHYRTIMERVTDAFVAIDNNWCYSYINKTAGKLLQKNQKELLGKNIWTEFPESRNNPIYTACTKAMQYQQYVYLEEYYEPFDKWYENHIYPSREGLSIFFKDITEYKKAEQQKEFDSNNLKALINNTDDLMWSVDTDFNLITSNEAFNKVVELMSGHKIEKGTSLLGNDFTEEQITRFRKYYKRAFNGESFTEVLHNEGPIDFWSEISFYPIQKGDEVIGTACFSRDITERKKTEENLKLLEQEMLEQKFQEQKKTARAIIKALEKERNHIGQELHDNINQILIGSKLYLSSAIKKNKALTELIKYPIELIDSSIEEIRLLCSNMVTPVKNINLRDIVHGLIASLQHNTMIKTEFNYSVNTHLLSDELKLNIYRILQEQVNNILKHAEAKSVMISIVQESVSINIIIQDDGKGFDTEKKRAGIGISNIITRIGIFDGEIDIKSSPGNGCTIEIRIPY